MDQKQLEFLTVQQTADLLQVRVAHVRKMLKAGVLPFVRPMPHTTRIPRAALEALARSAEVSR